MQLNAEELIFESGEIDLVVGGAILHHLFDPSKTLKEAYKVLKPGGYAIFYEPFEAGNQIVKLIFERILERNEQFALDNHSEALDNDSSEAWDDDSNQQKDSSSLRQKIYEVAE